MPDRSEMQLGSYLKDRRTKLDPAAFGFSLTRRRTPGLRREEVAQRAAVSVTWYTWLEQGRGGAPSPDVLDRIARALMLTDAERTHLFHLALGRPPEAHYTAADAVSPRLQRVLDALPLSPAIVRTPIWDVVAWNAAAAAVLTDYGKMATDERNILRLIFCDTRVRAAQPDWDSVARFVVASFRADAARAGATEAAEKLAEEMCQTSPVFAALWRDKDVRSHGEGTKHLRHALAGPIALDYSAFAVDGRPDLTMVVYTAVSPADTAKIQTLIAARQSLSPAEPLAHPAVARVG